MSNTKDKAPVKTQLATSARASLSSDENLVVGMIGGTVETTILMPVITYKFCKQEGRPYPKFPGMYRGLGVQAGSVAPLTAIQMFFNGIFENAMRGMKTNSSEPLSSAETILAGMGAGATSAVLYGPVDNVMIHQQKQNLSAFKTFQYLRNTHGTMSLFRGVGPTMTREAFYVSGYLAFAPMFTKSIMENESLGLQNNYFGASLLGAISAGLLSNITTHPVDTVKTVMQADVAKKTYTNAFQTFFKLLNERGMGSLFNGVVARTVRGCGAYFIVGSIREIAIQNKTKNGSPWSF